MSETQPTATDPNARAPDVNPMTDENARPWHGTSNPLEALWLHFTAEIAKLSGKKTPNPAADAAAAKEAADKKIADDATARAEQDEADRQEALAAAAPPVTPAG
jgi:hypothetical protein